MPSEQFVAKLNRTQARLYPVLRLALDQLGFIALFVGASYIFWIYWEIARHQFDRQDFLFLVMVLPFAIVMVYLILASSRRA